MDTRCDSTKPGIGCPSCAALWAEVRQLREENRQLRERVRELEAAAKALLAEIAPWRRVE